MLPRKSALPQKRCSRAQESKANKASFRFFHPDYTVGFGISPNQQLPKQPVAGFTAGGEFHPALKQTF